MGTKKIVTFRAFKHVRLNTRPEAMFKKRSNDSGRRGSVCKEIYENAMCFNQFHVKVMKTQCVSLILRKATHRKQYKKQ